MVLEHFSNNLHIRFNDGGNSKLVKGIVKLGHETSVVFEVDGIPLDINSVRVENNAFKTISRSQSALLILKEGFSKEHFVLNNVNNHTLALQVQGNKFVEAGQSRASFFSPYSGLLFIGLLGVSYLLYSVFWNKKMGLKTKH